ncbi:MAG: hypothetical protein P8182_12620 [Deltaproteobacteria bacterium]
MTNSNDRDSRHTGDPRIAEIEQELRLGNYLKDDDRPLARVLEEDADAVSRLNMDLDEITSRMKRFYDLGRAGLGDPVVTDDDFEITVREDRGIIPSPWRDHYAAPKAIIEVTNLKNGKTLKFSMLGWHLIRAHGFFQGKGSPFRIEPRELHDFFEET